MTLENKVESFYCIEFILTYDCSVPNLYHVAFKLSRCARGAVSQSIACKHMYVNAANLHLVNQEH